GNSPVVNINISKLINNKEVNSIRLIDKNDYLTLDKGSKNYTYITNEEDILESKNYHFTKLYEAIQHIMDS
ncbi:hypothetical protein, partial [Acinetobacter proteolyticus]|uniref:hypothetical protein n=1 Tax=Acinetobacter proteolyticus TaxID=1776741 RepID=UPI001C0977CF